MVQASIEQFTNRWCQSSITISDNKSINMWNWHGCKFLTNNALEGAKDRTLGRVAGCGQVQLRQA